jgi:large exoprotein involved in heme utilization and adhesion
LEGGDINITGEGTFGLGINARNFIGRGGTVFIDARGNLNAINSSIQTTALTEVGDIVLLAGETVYFDGADGRRPTGAFANIPADSEDIAGGTVRIGATNLEVLNGAQIASLVFGNGQGGDVLLSIRGTAYKASGSAIPSGAFSVIAPDSEGQGGDVRVQAGNVEVRDGANLSASTFGIGDAGNVILTVQGTVQVVGTDRQGNASGIDSSIDRGGEGRGGNVEIMARELEVLQGGQLSASTLGLGTAGSVLLDIEETASFVGANRFNGDPSGAFSSIERGGEGRGGNVEIMARELEVLQGGQLSVSTFGIGAAGSVLLDIEETASFVGANRFNGDPSGAFSSIQSGGEGRGGNIEIMARELEVLQGGQLSVSTFGIGAAGSVILNISETALFVGNNTVNGNPSGVFSTLGSDGEAEGGSEGQGGDVRVQAGNVEVQDGAELSASTFGLGNAGNVVLTVKDTVQVVGTDGQGNASSISSRINSGGEGRGGNVEITARELEVLQGGQLDVSTFGSGAAGSVLLTIEETASFIGANRFDGTPSGAFSSVERSGEGRGGNVEVQATQLEILDRAALFSASFGQGDAGTIALSIANRLLMDDGTIGTNSEGDSGGQINIKAGNIILRNDSDIQTFVANGEGGGGNITIAADFVIALDDSDILAFSADGTGGNIDLSQTTLFSENLNFAAGNLSRAELAALDGNNRVDINATGGIASGQISINDASVIENSLNELSGDLVDTAALTAGSCIARADALRAPLW